MNLTRKIPPQQIVRFFILIGVSLSFSVQVSSTLGQTSETDVAKISTSLISENHSLAINAAWQRVVIASKNRLANSPPRSRFEVPQEKCQRFLGFLEGSLQVSLPTNFSRNVMNSEILWNGKFQFPVQQFSVWNQEEVPFGASPTEIPLLICKIEGNQGQIRVSTGGFPSTGGDGILKLSDSFTKKVLDPIYKKHLKISSAIFTDKFVFVAFQQSSAPGGELICFSKSTEKELWSRPFSNYGGENYSGPVDWFTELRVVGERIVMFHCCKNSIAIEIRKFDGSAGSFFSSMKDTKMPGEETARGKE